MVEGIETLLRRLSEVATRPLDWAWEGLIPYGKVSLLTGEPGMGKSLVALQVAAMVTRGWNSPLSLAGLGPLGDLKTRPRSVLVLSAEDAADDTVKPRLIAAGGDAGRVHVLEGETREASQELAVEGENRLFLLTRDLPRLELALEYLKDSGEEVGLIVIDPIDRFLGPSDKKRDRVEVVARLVELAARWGAAVLVVANSSQKAGFRNGSVVYQELVNSARSVLMVAQDLENKDQRLLLPLKLNLSAMQPGRAFSIEAGGLAWKHEPVSISGDDYQQQAALKLKNPLVREEVYEIQRVTRWLKDQLTPGRASSIWIRCNAGYYDISYSTLRRAFKILGCKAIKSKNQWFWHLPGQEGSASQELLEEPLESPEGEICSVFRESMPNWLREENAAQELKEEGTAVPRNHSPVSGEDAHQGAQTKSIQGAQQDAQCEPTYDENIPAWNRY